MNRRGFLRIVAAGAAGCVASRFARVSGGAEAGGEKAARSGKAARAGGVGGRPNVVIIYGDDVGYGDVGAYGAKRIPAVAAELKQLQMDHETSPLTGR